MSQAYVELFVWVLPPSFTALRQLVKEKALRVDSRVHWSGSTSSSRPETVLNGQGRKKMYLNDYALYFDFDLTPTGTLGKGSGGVSSHELENRIRLLC